MLSTYDLCPCNSRKKFKFCCSKALKTDGLSKIAHLLPLICCYINPSWKTDKLAAVFIVRSMGSNKFLFGSYLIDTRGLGIKCAGLEIGMSDNRLRDWINQIPMETIPYEEARSLVLGAADFAEDWGFSPHKIYEHAQHLIEPKRPYQNIFEFGENGRPPHLPEADKDHPTHPKRDGVPKEEATDSFLKPPNWYKCKDEVEQILSAYMQERLYGSELIEMALKEYLGFGKECLHLNEFASLFHSWLYYTWKIRTAFFNDDNTQKKKKTISQKCMDEHPEYFTPDQKALILATCTSPFSFYLIEEEVILPHRFKLRNIFLEEECVEHYLESEDVKPGMVLFGRLVSLGDQAMWLDQAPYPLPSSCLSYLEEMKKRYTDQCMSPSALLTLDVEFWLAYWKLQGQDDEALSPREILYELKCSPKEAFHRLSSLSTLSTEAILQGENRDGHDRWTEVTFYWEKFSENPDCLVDFITLARITISEEALKVQVKSNNQADKIKREIKKRLGKRAIYK